MNTLVNPRDAGDGEHVSMDTSQCNKRQRSSFSEECFDDFTRDNLPLNDRLDMMMAGITKKRATSVSQTNDEENSTDVQVPSSPGNELGVDNTNCDRGDSINCDIKNKKSVTTSPIDEDINNNSQNERTPVTVGDHVNSGGERRGTDVNLIPRIEKEIYIVSEQGLKKCVNKPEFQRYTEFDEQYEDWPAGIPELWEAIQDRADILSLERMYRRRWDVATRTASLSATDSIMITFKSRNIRNLKIFQRCVNLRVRPFIPQTKQCFNCFKFGHTKMACKSDTRCIVCGKKSHGNGQCIKPMRCFNCHGPHKSTFRGCSMYKRNRNINETMAYNNISFHSARRLVEGRSLPTDGPVDSRMDPTSWPALPSRRMKPMIPETRESAPRKFSYADSGPPRVRSRARPISSGIGNYFAQFNSREEEITTDRRGLALSGNRGAPRPQVVRREVGDEAVQRGAAVNEIVASVMSLIEKFPLARMGLIEALTRGGREASPPVRGGAEYGAKKDMNMEEYRRNGSQSYNGGGLTPSYEKT
ncbi:uncharacterized protein LOC143906475 [Temnothorax americanus]|uniref:uncharacterized protein LOC143906475 n=1 Tax=Temnothorax americanus TaxID=1964332 RepID=UPI00406762D1